MTKRRAEGGLWVPDFQPDWPDVVPIGTWILRTTVFTDALGDQADAAEGMSWKILGGRGEEVGGPTLNALIGELTVRDGNRFAGVTVVCPFGQRKPPVEHSEETDRDFVRRYGVWASSFMYDYAATNLRSALAGAGLDLNVQWSTPTVELPQLAEPD